MVREWAEEPKDQAQRFRYNCLMTAKRVEYRDNAALRGDVDSNSELSSHGALTLTRNAFISLVAGVVREH
jgi:hypothetical protein